MERSFAIHVEPMNGNVPHQMACGDPHQVSVGHQVHQVAACRERPTHQRRGLPALIEEARMGRPTSEQPGPGIAPRSSGSEVPWWRTAVIYEVYPRSFADSDDDGEGDLEGVRHRMPYLASLGVDAVWFAPWFPSPMADGGYDVTDYRDIHPLFGTLADADALVAEAHRLGIKVVVDMVANHTSHEHPWFRAALQAAPGSPERDRYLFRDGRGDSGSLPPNNWISAFGGPAWTRVPDAEGKPGQWYLHTFAPEQPDLNWSNDDVLLEFDDILRFWFDRGIDGLRVDAAPAFAKKPDLPDADYGPDPRFDAIDWVDNPHWDVDEVHDILRRWRTVADEYEGDRVFVTEAVVNGPERLSRYLRPDEMHTAFNFSFLKAPWDPGLREIIDGTLSALEPVGAPATWVLASHDETRLVTRYGRARTGTAHLADDAAVPADLELGRRRARAATLLMLALPGGAYIYQGEELGLPEVQDIPEHLLQDPIWVRSGHTLRGRDGCRVPMPWEGDRPPFGFTAEGVTPWLPQPAGWSALTVAAQSDDPTSFLALHRRALQLRREVAGFRSTEFRWRESDPDVLDFERTPDVRCVVNLSGRPVPLGGSGEVVLSSIPLDGDLLPTDAAVWIVGP
jgi:alpha-glucosidase